MKQVLQHLGNGKVEVLEVPAPVRPPGYVLVRNHASLISSGTEGMVVKAARASLLGKARQHPEKVRQVLDSLRKEGLPATIAKVRRKLDAPLALGYSSAGVVLETDEDETRFQPGDLVACAGAGFAAHAEIVAVPRNLVARVPKGVAAEDAAFATVGAIALQGIRRGEIQFGERVLVIGLGLLGQLTWQLLRDAGCTVVGIDVCADAVERARRLGLKEAYLRQDTDVAALCHGISGGHGMDAVIVTAETRSKEPLETAGKVLRERGRVVLVGAVPIEVPRLPYYLKELDLRVSRAYGPGRYDRQYEEHGRDYPFGHVRWTEGRNMEAFLDALARGRVATRELVTHRFPVEDARRAYDIVAGEVVEPHLGMLLEYPRTAAAVDRRPIELKPVEPVAGRIGIGFLGAGAFADGALLPELAKRADVQLMGIASGRGYSALDLARKYGFTAAHSGARALLADDRIDAVFIATRHDSHAKLVVQALEAGKHVFVEKPLAITRAQLDAVEEAAAASGRVLQVGYNRRHSPLAKRLKEVLAAGAAPAQITYRVNAGPLPPDHWTLDPKVGGGRVIGECCHFLDLVLFLTGERPARVQAARLGDEATGATTILLELDGGSVATIIYQANAPRRLPKERLEAWAGGLGGTLVDWRRLTLQTPKGRVKIRSPRQRKGIPEEIAVFLEAVSTTASGTQFATSTDAAELALRVVEALGSRRA